MQIYEFNCLDDAVLPNQSLSFAVSVGFRISARVPTSARPTGGLDARKTLLGYLHGPKKLVSIREIPSMEQLAGRLSETGVFNCGTEFPRAGVG
jgi:hypothetical protein